MEHKKYLTMKEVEAVIKGELPEFYRMCNSEIDEVVLHQRAFAPEYNLMKTTEVSLLGMAIKYAGYKHKVLHILYSKTEEE